MSKYKIKEIYLTLQGEGMQSGRPAVFCRFSGCNLWSGREVDREKAICNFCDTDFIGTDGEQGGKYNAADLAKKVRSLWRGPSQSSPYVVCTGGEPLLQLDFQLIDAFHSEGMEIGLETNGTIIPPVGIDWICVSPKPNVEIKLTQGDELKLIFPQENMMPDQVEQWNFTYFFLQPMHNLDWEENTRKTVEYCLSNPQWRLSMQSHKYLGIN